MSYQDRRTIISIGIVLLIILSGLTSCKSSQHLSRKAPTISSEGNFYKNYAARLGFTLSGNENRKLIESISEWLGTPYKYGGCDKSGTDCSCFVRSIVKEVYDFELHRRSQDMILDVTKVSKGQLSNGDLVFFKISGNKISHVGIYISSNKFVHASKKRGVVINDLNEGYYKKYFYSGGRLKL